MNIGNLTAYLGVDMTGFEAALLSAEGQMKKMGKSMQTVGRSMSMYVTAAILAFGGGAVMSFKGFEESMSRIIGLVGVAKEQASQWEKEILKMAPALGKSPKELADALYFITSAGISGKDAMDVLTVSAKAASAGLGQTEVVANLVTSAMNAYGAANLSAAQATDILVGATKAGKAEASQLAEAMGMVLPLASAMGVSFDQVAAGMAGMTLTGASASEAATGLRSILANIQKPSMEAEEALKSMGTSSAILRKTIREDGLLKAMQDITNLTKTYGETAVSDVIPDIRALSSILDLMGKNAEGNAKIFSDLKNATGLLDQSFAAAAQTTQFRFNSAISQGKVALIEIGKSVSTAIIPILEGLVKVVQGVGKWFGGLSDSSKRIIIVMAGITAAIGPLIYIVGGLITSFSKLFAIMKLVSSSIMMMNPLSALGTAIAAVVIGLIAWGKASNSVSAAQKKFNEQTNQSIAAMDVVFRRLKDTNTSQSEKAKIIGEINSQYGEYLPHLLTEKSSLQDIERAQTAVNNKLIENIAIKLSNVEKEKIAMKELELRQQLVNEGVDLSILKNKELLKYAQKVANQAGTGTRIFIAADMALDKQLKTIGQSAALGLAYYQDLEDEMSKIDSNYRAMTEGMKQTFSTVGDSVEDVSKKGSQSTKEQVEVNDKFIQTLKAINQEYQLAKALLTDKEQLKEAEIKGVTDIYNAYKEYYISISKGNKLTTEQINKLKELYAIIEGFKTPSVSFTKDLISGMTEELQAFVDELNKPIKGKGGKDGMLGGFSQEIKTFLDRTKIATDNIKEMWNSVKQSMSQNIAALATSIGLSLGGMEQDWADMALNALKAIQQVMQGLMAEALLILFTTGAIKGGLVVGLIAATTGLAAIIAMMQNSQQQLQGMYMGGDVLKSGAFQINERGGETAILPKGTKVLAHGASSQEKGGFVAKTKIAGSDILVIIERATSKKKRGA